MTLHLRAAVAALFSTIILSGMWRGYGAVGAEQSRRSKRCDNHNYRQRRVASLRDCSGRIAGDFCEQRLPKPPDVVGPSPGPHELSGHQSFELEHWGLRTDRRPQHGTHVRLP